ncbi:MAG: amidohydrolase family protein [Polaromonas sp.]|nr:amidohydrolase family protein [Polaromonas sp.]
MLELCQPPIAAIRRPKLICPPGTTDCHVHVYGPTQLYPPAVTRSFDVPDALPSTLATVMDVLGVERVVLVQPSGYGTDNRRHLEAAAQLGRPARVIAALRADTPDNELARLNALGVRGVRYNIGHKGAVPIEEMPTLSRRIAKLGWHVQLHVMDDGGGAPLAAMERTLMCLESEFVIDHMGSLRPEEGVSQLGFQTLLRLIKTGRCWVKLSSSYRMSKMPAPYVDMLPYVNALLDIGSDRLLWASDWPHVSFKGKMPNTADLLDQMLTWLPDESTRQKILVKNPEVLYGF